VFIQSEASDEKVHSKKGGTLKNDPYLGPITVKQIQDLIANAVKISLGEMIAKFTFYTKPYAKRVGAYFMPFDYQTLKF